MARASTPAPRVHNVHYTVLQKVPMSRYSFVCECRHCGQLFTAHADTLRPRFKHECGQPAQAIASAKNTASFHFMTGDFAGTIDTSFIA